MHTPPGFQHCILAGLEGNARSPGIPILYSMFTVDDLFALCADQDALQSILVQLGFQDARPETCPKCGEPLDGKLYLRRGKDHWRCNRHSCGRWVPVQSGQLEGFSAIDFSPRYRWSTAPVMPYI